MNQRLPDVRISKRGFYAMRESGFPRLHLMARLGDVGIEEKVFRTQRTRAGTTHGLEKAWDRYGVSTSVNGVEGS